MGNKKRIYVLLIFMLIPILTVLCTNTNSNNAYADEVSYNLPFEAMLREHLGDSFNDYRQGKKASEIISIYERTYSDKDPSKFSMELIAYKNPKDSWCVYKTIDIKIGSEYKVFELEEKETYADNFRRYRVVDPENQIYRQSLDSSLNKNCREYEISNVNVIVGKTHIVRGKYVYTGYDLGLSVESEKESTLKSKIVGTTVVESEVRHFSYDVPDKKAKTMHWKIYSVAFSLPSYLENDEWKLNSVKARYIEKLLMPIFSTSNKAIKNYLEENAGKDSSEMPKHSLTMSEVNGFHPHLFALMTGALGMMISPFLPPVYNGFVWNPTKMEMYRKIYRADYEVKKYAGVIEHKERTAPATKEEVRKLLEKIGGKDIDHWKEYESKIITEENLNAYFDEDGNVHNGLQEINLSVEDVAKGKSIKNLLKSKTIPKEYQKLFRRMKKMEGIPTHKKIEEVNDSNINKSAKDLLVNQHELQELKDFYKQNNEKGHKTYLMRFAVRQSLRTAVNAYRDGTLKHFNYKKGGETYVTQSKAFMDFRIIQFEFKRYNELKTVPVGHNPLHVIPGTTSPPLAFPLVNNKKLGKLKKFFIIFGVAVGVLFLTGSGVWVYSKVAMAKGISSLSKNKSIEKTKKRR